ncbi:MAG: 50S ribosomal protein L21 [candidate division WOR-3 bacterium]
MFAVIRVAGFQYIVEKGMRIIVPAVLGKVGETINLGDVLLYSEDEDIKIGRPVLSDMRVEGKITKVGQMRKVIVYKFIRRENYRRKKGHRQDFTEIEITEIKGSKS